jgi:hypothetical protein
MDPYPYPHPGINFSSLNVGGDAGGLLFVVGSVFVIVGGLGLETFFFGSLAAGAIVALILIRAHRPTT